MKKCIVHPKRDSSHRTGLISLFQTNSGNIRVTRRHFQLSSGGKVPKYGNLTNIIDAA